MKRSFQREMTVSAEHPIDENTFDIAFSSENPYPREYETERGKVVLNEVLVHEPDSADLSKLNNKASVLFNHDFDKHVGCVVEGTARIDDDRVGRCKVRISQVGELSQEVLGKLKEGTLSQISVGYEVLDYRIDWATETLYVTKWQPYETSLVTVAADPFGAGVGRSLNTGTNDDEHEGNDVNKDNQKPEQEQKQEEQETEKESTSEPTKTEQESEPAEQESEKETDSASEDEPKQEERAAEPNDEEQKPEEQPEQKSDEPAEDEPKQEFERPEEDAEEMRAIGKYAGKSDDEIEKAVRDKSVTVESYKRSLNNIVTNSTNSKRGANMDTFENLQAKFDLGAAVRSHVEGKALTGAEAEFQQEHQRQCAARGKVARGIAIPTAAMRQALTNNENVAGITPTDLRYDSFVHLLMQTTALSKLRGVNVMQLNGVTAIPRMTDSAVKSWGFVPENGVGVEGKAVFDNVTLKPHTFTGSVVMTRQAMINAPQISNLLATHITRAMGARLEQILFAATDAENAPKSLVTALSAEEIDFTAKGFAVAAGKMFDAGVADMQWLMSGARAADLAYTLADAGVAGRYVLEDGKIAGVDVVSAGTVGENVFCGDFSSLTIGEFGAVELDLDDTTYRNSGAMAIRLFADIDWSVTGNGLKRFTAKTSKAK